MPDDPGGARAERTPRGSALVGEGEMRQPTEFSPSLLAEPDVAQTELSDGGVRLQSRRRRSARAGKTTAGQREAARLITMAWGDRYIEELLSLTVPALLAPGNLPAFVEHFDVEFVVVTETRLFELISRRPATLALLEYCDVRLVPIDDLLSPWYGITLTFALLRGFADMGADMVGAHLLFINTDFVLGDGSYRNLAKMILRGERLIVAPSHCMVHEDTIGPLNARYDSATCSIAIPPRELAALVLRHRHNTVRAKTVNQQLFRLHWHDQFYWHVDDETLLARQLPIAVVYMRPERVVTELPTFWDYGMLSEICPTTRPCVLGDSDEFLMAEMRGRDTLRSFLRLGWPSIDELATDLSCYITKDHYDYGRFPLVLHSADLPAGLAAERAQFDAFMTALYERLAPRKSYRNHPFWAEGWERFRTMRAQQGILLEQRLQATAALRQQPAYAERAQRLTSLRAQLAQLERRAALEAVALHREEARLGALLRSAEHARDERVKPLQELQQRLRREIAELAQQQELDGASAGPSKTTGNVPAAPVSCRPEEPQGRLASVYQTIFGRVPHTTPWHPYHTSLRHVRAALKAAVADGAGRMLFIASDDPLAPLLISDLAVEKTSVTPLALSHRELAAARGDAAPFDCCFCYLSFKELPRFRAMMDELRPAIRRGGRVVVFYHNQDLHPLDTFELTSSFFPIVGKSRVSLTGSLPAALAIRWHLWLVARGRGSRVLNLVSRAVAQLVCAPLARLAAAVEEKQDPRRHPRHCTGMTMEIEVT